MQSQECLGKKKQLPDKVIDLKEASGILFANCESCDFLSSEGDGPEYNGSWPVCAKIERMSYLKSFPFKKRNEMLATKLLVQYNGSGHN